MKNITAIFMALILLVLPLAGCGAQEAPEGRGFPSWRRFLRHMTSRGSSWASGGRSLSCCPRAARRTPTEPTPKDIIDIQNCDLFISRRGDLGRLGRGRA